MSVAMQLFRVRVFALLTVFLAAGVARATVESELVKGGMAAYDDLDYAKSIELLAKALGETLTKEEKVVTYRTLAFAHVAIDKTAEAEADFQELLKVDPTFQLNRTISPRVRKVFESAQAKFAQSGIVIDDKTPGLHTEVAPRLPKQGQPVSIRVTYPGGLAQKMTIFYHTRGQRKFSTLEVKGASGAFQATIPGVQVQAPALEYYMTLVDDQGAGMASAGSLGRPLFLDVEAPKKPLYAKGWFWGVVGGAVAAGVVAGVLGAMLPYHITSTTPATLTIQPN
jgi:hypothetical protein